MARTWLAAVAGVLVVAASLSGCAARTEHRAEGANAAVGAAFPAGPVEIIAPAAPGGGWDTTARLVQKVLSGEQLVSTAIAVVNRPGGGGQVGWSYLNEHQGDGHYLAMNSTQLFPPELTATSKMKFEDFTPLARLTTEYLALVVKADSPYQNGKELLDTLKQDPGKLSVGIGSGVASNDHVSFLQAAKSHGVDVKNVRIVVFSSGGEQMTALLGGNVDAVSTGISEAIEQAKAGNLRIIAVTSPERLDELPDVPTWAELGIDGTFYHWRGIQGPGGMTPEQVAAWDAILEKMVKSEAWKRELAAHGWTDAYLPSRDFSNFLTKSRVEFAAVLTEVGIAKQRG